MDHERSFTARSGSTCDMDEERRLCLAMGDGTLELDPYEVPAFVAAIVRIAVRVEERRPSVCPVCCAVLVQKGMALPGLRCLACNYGRAAERQRASNYGGFPRKDDADRLFELGPTQLREALKESAPERFTRAPRERTESEEPDSAAIDDFLTRLKDALRPRVSKTEAQ